MREISDKVNEECKKAKVLRNMSWKTDNETIRNNLRKQQKEHYEKFMFFKKLGIAVDKEKER